MSCRYILCCGLSPQSLRFAAVTIQKVSNSALLISYIKLVLLSTDFDWNEFSEKFFVFCFSVYESLHACMNECMNECMNACLSLWLCDKTVSPHPHPHPPKRGKRRKTRSKCFLRLNVSLVVSCAAGTPGNRPESVDYIRSVEDMDRLSCLLT